MARFLLTGATGFVGSHLTRALLAAGHDVTALVCDDDHRSRFLRDHDSVTIVEGRVEDPYVVEPLVQDGRFDTIVHLAAEALVGRARRDPAAALDTNVRGTWLLLEACRGTGPSAPGIVVASSDKAYGPCPDLPYTERTPFTPRHPYDVSKACADLIAGSYAATYGLRVAIARCGNIVGPGDTHWSRLVPGTIRDLLAGHRPVVRSDGTPVRDWLTIDDAVRGYLALADWLDYPGSHRETERAFNFSPEQPLSVLDIVTRLRHATGRVDLTPVIQGGAKDEIPRQHLDSTRARDVLGWRPRGNLDRCLADTVAWCRALPAHQRDVASRVPT